MVIELDGDSHLDRQAYDKRRQEYLEGQGMQVVRFLNEDVFADVDAVCNAIIRVSRRTPSP